MRFGICGGIDRSATIQAAGADYLEPAVAYDATPEASRSDWLKKLAVLRASGLTAEAWNCWLPGDLRIVGPGIDWERYRRYTHSAIERVAEAGGKVIVFGSGGARRIPDGYDRARAVDEFARAATMAAESAAAAGIDIAVEALESSETNLLNTVSQTVEFVKKLGIPNLKCTADFHHMRVENEPNDVLFALGQHIGHAHLADSDRLAPGTGSADTAGFLRALKDAGYRGRVSIECRWDDFDRQAAPSLRFIRETWSRVSDET